MAEDKYKIKIVRTGIGDPFLVGEFYFDTENGLDPAQHPVDGLDIQIEFQMADNDFHTFGHIKVSKQLDNWAKTQGMDSNYHFGLPFDPGSLYEVGDAVVMKLTFTTGNHGVELDGGSNNHSTYTLVYDPAHALDFSTTCYYYWTT